MANAYNHQIYQLMFKKNHPDRFFSSARHPLTLPNEVILCKKNDAIKNLGLYRFYVQARRFMMVKIDFAYDHTLNFFFGLK